MTCSQSSEISPNRNWWTGSALDALLCQLLKLTRLLIVAGPPLQTPVGCIGSIHSALSYILRLHLEGYASGMLTPTSPPGASVWSTLSQPSRQIQMDLLRRQEQDITLSARPCDTAEQAWTCCPYLLPWDHRAGVPRTPPAIKSRVLMAPRPSDANIARSPPLSLAFITHRTNASPLLSKPVEQILLLLSKDYILPDIYSLPDLQHALGKEVKWTF